MFTSNSSWI
ncbi:hypothetical protein YPPY46_1208, partial [Yersinia pestis PY-46]